MKFLFSFVLLVLPLFLLVCIQIIRQNEDFRRSIAGKILELIFFVFALAAIATGVYLIISV